ncbi:hypothetical protein B0H14DRAFT_2586321 [Mycena olivaceomarginata]|nr:hypothetical protein B0H14DRAFT_2586321 [Mycena olivaceomarginata]
MMENLRCIRAVTNSHRELPPVHMGQLVVPPRDVYLAWLSIKKRNRHSEILLRDFEHVATLASLTGKKKYVYRKHVRRGVGEATTSSPGDRVRDMQCVNELHRGMVYDDAEAFYAEVRAAGEEMLDDALGAAPDAQEHTAKVQSSSEADSEADPDDGTLYIPVQ